MEKNKSNRITELQDSDFLSFLYSERAREESLNSYQGWSVWAVIGAIITVICTGYANVSNKYGEIDILRVGYILSCIAGFILCYRPYFLMLKFFYSKERGYDVKNVKYLKDVCPYLYLWFTFFISLAFSIFIPINDSSSPWNVVSVCWIFTTILLFFAIVYVEIKKDKIVWSLIDGLIFGEIKLDKWFGYILGGVLSIVWIQSLKKAEGEIIGSPDVEMAVFSVVVVSLIYLLIKILASENMSSFMDVLLDDYLYKGKSKENIYHEILTRRMGYGVLEACFREVYAIRESLNSFEPQKAKIEEVDSFFSDETYDINHIPNYYNIIQSAFNCIDKLKGQSEALQCKLSQIEKQVPSIEKVEEFINILEIANTLLDEEYEILKKVNSAASKMNKGLKKYYCKKYGGLCIREGCSHRQESMSWINKMFLFRIRFAQRIGVMIKPRRSCNS